MQLEDSKRRPVPPFDRDSVSARLPLVRGLADAHRTLVMAAGEWQRQRAGAVF